MVIVHNPLTPLSLKKKLAIAIGTFDGIHKGHQAVIQSLVQTAQEKECCSALITYDNHPSEILRPEQTTPLIYPSSHKIALLKTFSIDYLILYTFNSNFASQTAEQFLSHLMKICPFSYLNMGYDGLIGKNRTGDKQQLTALADRLGFTLEYSPSCNLNNAVVSSTTIRQYIKEGKLQEASGLLGRQYSISGLVVSGQGIGAEIGFPTANILIQGLVTPPPGVWAVEAHWEDQHHWAVANLGYAPTVHKDRDLMLEVHIPHVNENLYGKNLEVIFKHYLRSEKRFETLDSLKQQLRRDISAAQAYFKK